MKTLQLYTFDSSVRSLYTTLDTGRNSGYDLYLPSDTMFPPHKVVFVNFNITGKCVDDNGNTHAYLLMQRSSISKTTLRMANSVGLIDQDYRGSIMAALENTSDQEVSFPRGTRLVQLVQADLQPFKVEFTKSKLDTTERGEGGFGSTGI
jgi:dUTP pyrophosphatase